MKTPQKSGFGSKLAIGFLPILTGLWVPFIHLYLLNAGNLTLPFSVHLPILATISAIGFFTALALQSLMPKHIGTGISYFLLLTGIYFWAESTLFLGDFGFLQGGEMDWGKNQHLLYFELLLVGIFILLVFRLKGKLIQNAGWITLVIFISSLANIYPAFEANRSRTKSSVEHTFTLDDVFRLSPEKNVLLFIIDTYQADIFADLIAENPQWKDVFNGFTFFPNATSAFPKTYASIPNILTGRAFDNSEPFPTFMENAYLGKSAPKILKDHGFDVRYRSFTWQPYFAHPEVADNLAGFHADDGRQWIQKNEFTKLANLATFRLSPFLAKPWVYNENEFRLSESVITTAGSLTPYNLTEDQRLFSRDNSSKDLQFLDRMTAFLQVDSAKPAFRVFHLLGIHAKLKLDAELNYIGHQPITPETFREQAKGMLKLLSLTFDRLKQEGAYDNSLIFVVGDHGGGEYGRIQVLQDASGKIGLDVDFGPSAEPLDSRLVQGGIPAILVKPIGSKQSLKISSSPVQLSDIPNTVCGELGFSESMTGPSMFGIPEKSPRVRTHRHYQFSGWGQDYIVPMTEYRIDGFSWNPKSWSPTGRDLNSLAVNSIEGELVILGEGGNLDEFEHQGWSKALRQGRRFSGYSASITVPYPKKSENMILEIRTRPSLPPEEIMPMRVFVNDEMIAVWSLSQTPSKKMFAHIPTSLCGNNSDFRVRFEMGKNNEYKPLIIELRIVEHPGRQQCSLGEDISFKLGANSVPFLGPGWMKPEKWGTWTDGFWAAINLQLDSPPGQDLEVTANFRPAVFPGSPPLLVDVIANGEIVDFWTFPSKGSKQKVFHIPGYLIQDSQVLDLNFSIHNPRRPKDFTKATDPRHLGLGFRNLVIRKSEIAVSRGFSPIGQELLFNEIFAASWTGLNRPENWSGTQVIWTKGEAVFETDLPTSSLPTAVKLAVRLAPKRDGYLVACANGVLIGAERANKFPWNCILDLTGVPSSNSLRIALYSTTQEPQNAPPDRPDSRRLGLALSSMMLTRRPLAAMNWDNALAPLDKPVHLILHPNTSHKAQWSGLHNQETDVNHPLAWTNGKAVCTTEWNLSQPPSYLLVDIAKVAVENSKLTIEINGVPILNEDSISADWSRLVDISGVPLATNMEIVITSDSAVPAENQQEPPNQRPLGIALRQLLILQ